MPDPTLQQVLTAGNVSDKDIGLGNVIRFGNGFVELKYVPSDDPDELAEIHLVPVGPNAANVRTVLFNMGKGLWIFDPVLGEPIVAVSDNGLHCAKNLTAHLSVAGRNYVESTEGFIKAATFLCAEGGVLRFLGEQPTRPQLWYDSDWLEYVFNNDTGVDEENEGSAPLRAENVVSAKAGFYYNENLMNLGPGMKTLGLYNIDTITIPNSGSGDYSVFRITYERPIKDPVVVFTPYANNLSNGDPIVGSDTSPIIASIIKSTNEYTDIQLWQGLCVPEPIQIINYGFNIFNDLGGHLHVSGPLEINP